jgi:ATP-binding cassette subfamily F protein 3
MDEYQKLILSGSLTAPGGKGGSGYDPNLSKAEQRKANVERRAAVAPLKKAVTAAEQAMAKIALEKAKIDAKLTDGGLYDGPKEKLNALLKQQGELGNALAAAEAAWLEAVEALDAAQAA